MSVILYACYSWACHGHFFEKVSRVDVAVVFRTFKTKIATGTFSEIVTEIFSKNATGSSKNATGKKTTAETEAD